MPRFDPADPIDPLAAERSIDRPVEPAFPSWARMPARRDSDPQRHSGCAFFAGAALALFDQTTRAEPSFAGALRHRLALRAAVACAAMARLREDETAVRDAEHLVPASAATTPAGRLHRLWRLAAARPPRLDAAGLRDAADLVEAPPDLDCAALAASLRDVAATAADPLAAAARTSAAASAALGPAKRVEVEILVFWLADLVLAQGLGWERPAPLLATAIAHASLRSARGRRPRPDDADWPRGCAGAYALAAEDAGRLAGELSRRSARLLAVAPRLRAKGAGRVVDLLLADDAVSPAHAARAAGLSDRAARRLFDRLVALGAVRELSGRPSFRLYGL